MNDAATLTGDLESIAVADIDHDVLYEVVNGQRVEPPPMGVFDTFLANVLSYHLYGFASSGGLGRTVMEMLFRLAPLGNVERRPDVAFVSYHRWPRNRPVPRTAAWDVVPELTVEVVSPNNAAPQMLCKVHEYFQAGVERVWVVYPNVQQVYVYSSPTQIRVLTMADELDGEHVLPGFRLAVAALFEPEAEGATA